MRGTFQAGRGQSLSIVIECHQAGIECGVPQGRQQKSVMHVEPLSVRLTASPWHHMRRSQEIGTGYPAQRATPIPILHQGISKNVLPDPELLCALTFGIANARDGLLIFLKRKIREADR